MAALHVYAIGAAVFLVGAAVIARAGAGNAYSRADVAWWAIGSLVIAILWPLLAVAFAVGWALDLIRAMRR